MSDGCRIRIDEERCQGHGRCYTIAPALFEPDDYGHGRVVGSGLVPAEAVPDARMAAANCPEEAVIIEEGA